MNKAFDYKKFANFAKTQAELLIPEDILQNHREEFINRIYNFTYVAGEALANDENIKSPEVARLVTQLVSEWTFHKYVDILRSDIPESYHESLLQKLAFVVYEIGKEAVINDLSVDQVCHLVEFHLNKEYKKACDSLFNKGYIAKDIYEKALSLSNVSEMTLQHNVKVVRKNRKSTYKYTVSVLIIGIVALLVNLFLPGMGISSAGAFLKIFDTVMIIFLSLYLGMVIMYMWLRR